VDELIPVIGNLKTFYREELIVKNLSEFCKDKELDASNLSRISKNGKLYKKWRCICLSDTD
jgi:hypothetical protein